MLFVLYVDKIYDDVPIFYQIYICNRDTRTTMNFVPSIIVDSNRAEHELYQLLCRMNPHVNVSCQRCEVGDVILRPDPHSEYIIERKTWEDLGASICDGRFHDQKKRMLESETDFIVSFAFIVQGPLPDWEGTLSHTSMHNKCLWGAVVKSITRDQMHVFHSASMSGTASLISYLFTHLVENTLYAQRQPVGTRSRRKRSYLERPENAFREMLKVVPGMSIARAEALAGKYPNMEKLLSASEEDIAKIQVGSKALGPAVSKRIKSVFEC